MRRLAPLLLVVAAGCVDANDTVPLPGAGDLETFASLAQPVLAARCANPSCHGTAERPLSLFAERRFRLDPAHVYLDAPLTPEELVHNHRQAAAFLEGVADAAQSLLLSKPLAVEAGGSGHVAGAVFADPSDYDYRRLHAWVTAALGEREPSAADEEDHR